MNNPTPDEADFRAAARADLYRVVAGLAFIVTLCTLAFLVGVTS